MKLDVRPMDVVRNFLSICTVVGVLGGIAYSAGWIVNESRAGEIAEQKLSPESIERMEFQIEYKRSQLRVLLSREDRTAADQVEITELETQIESLRTRIAKARGQEE